MYTKRIGANELHVNTGVTRIVQKNNGWVDLPLKLNDYDINDIEYTDEVVLLINKELSIYVLFPEYTITPVSTDVLYPELLAKYDALRLERENDWQMFAIMKKSFLAKYEYDSEAALHRGSHIHVTDSDIYIGHDDDDDEIFKALKSLHDICKNDSIIYDELIINNLPVNMNMIKRLRISCYKIYTSYVALIKLTRCLDIFPLLKDIEVGMHDVADDPDIEAVFGELSANYNMSRS